MYHPTCIGCRDGILNQEGHYGYGGCLYDEDCDENDENSININNNDKNNENNTNITNDTNTSNDNTNNYDQNHIQKHNQNLPDILITIENDSDSTIYNPAQYEINSIKQKQKLLKYYKQKFKQLQWKKDQINEEMKQINTMINFIIKELKNQVSKAKKV